MAEFILVDDRDVLGQVRNFAQASHPHVVVIYLGQCAMHSNHSVRNSCGWINWQYNKVIRAINSTMRWSNQLASAIGWSGHSDIKVQVTSGMFGGTIRIVYAFQRSQETLYALVKYFLGLTEKHATLRTCELQNMNMVCVLMYHRKERIWGDGV